MPLVRIYNHRPDDFNDVAVNFDVPKWVGLVKCDSRGNPDGRGTVREPAGSGRHYWVVDDLTLRGGHSATELHFALEADRPGEIDLLVKFHVPNGGWQEWRETMVAED